MAPIHAEFGPDAPEGIRRAIDLMRACSSDRGFFATPSERGNYRRVWGRDSSIIGLASLVTGDEALVDGCRRSLETLVACQGPHGEIPSNVDPVTGRISYGGTAGRVDASLWFVIACAAYWRTTGDEGFLQRILEPLERVRFLLGAWEFNARGLIYVPATGDWADEYVPGGYVLYDQLLYLQAQRGFAAIHEHLHRSPDHLLEERVVRLKRLIRANYWFEDESVIPHEVYHRVPYERGRRHAGATLGTYWLPTFSPLGYGNRFDAMANALAILFGVADEAQAAAVDAFVDEQLLHPGAMLLPSFHPVITPDDTSWQALRTAYRGTFKNAPHEYQNGGLWPIVTAFYAAGLAVRGKVDLARRYLNAIHAANRVEREGEPWAFSEYLNGATLAPGGTPRMGWSAASALIAHAYVEHRRLFL